MKYDIETQGGVPKQSPLAKYADLANKHCPVHFQV